MHMENLPWCGLCRHVDRLNKSGVMRCSAFPDGIPDSIMSAEIAHFDHLPGDHGVMFDLEDNLSELQPKVDRLRIKFANRNRKVA